MFCQKIIDLGFIDPNITIFYFGLELMQGFFIVILGNPGIYTVIPTVKATNKVVSIHISIGHQSPAVQAATVKDGYGTIISYDDQIQSIVLVMYRLFCREIMVI